MRWRVRTHRLAQREYYRAYRWFAAFNSVYAQNFVDDFEELVDKVSERPLEGAPHDHDTRLLRFRRAAYHLIYYILDDEIVIMAVAQESQRSNYWHRRLKDL